MSEWASAELDEKMYGHPRVFCLLCRCKLLKGVTRVCAECRTGLDPLVAAVAEVCAQEVESDGTLERVSVLPGVTITSTRHLGAEIRAIPPEELLRRAEALLKDGN